MIVKSSVGEKVYEFRFRDYGVEMRESGGKWLDQGLVFVNIVTLIETKNTAFDRHAGDPDKARVAWQKDVIRRLQNAMKPKRKPAR